MGVKSTKWIIGIDEAGRGPLAGPVVVGAVKISRYATKILRGIRDSKKLSAKKREEWFAFLTKHPQITWAVAAVSPRVIDRVNISCATNLGVRCVCSKLSLERRKLSLEQNGHMLLDGGLKLPHHIPHKVIIKGDEKIPVIAAASIIAKVTRDRQMVRLHKKYPQYRFDIHKGYGTKLHRELVQKFGRSAVHRKSFAVLTVA